ncbi:alpha-hydroxy acid oxidase [Dokdonella sp. MW10]|uniref:alpha-hydroxy acid oxidase n=1 Tax=Dokdonella sp. MW10 TaxID=2992926 RepID=UPI003F81EBAB
MPLPPLERIPSDVVALADYAPLARERMTDAAWAYLDGGAADESTLADNLAAFRRVRLAGRVLGDFDGANTRVELFGTTFDHPILLAPIALQKLAHPLGELASAQAAAALGAGMVVSTEASTTLEAIALAAPAPLWFQLYIQHDRDFTTGLVARAEAAGYRALVVTVDAPVAGMRDRERRAGFALPEGVAPVNLDGLRAPPPQVSAGPASLFDGPLPAAAPTWKDIEALVASTHLPVLLKGILRADDARRALDHGVAGIVVSNHGGRTLDTAPATLDALPGVVAAVAERVPVLLDGGIRRGTDVLKALALGARAVLVGRPYVHALAAAGAPGVAHVLHILRSEFEVAMMLAGCATPDRITRDVIWPGG